MLALSDIELRGRQNKGLIAMNSQLSFIQLGLAAGLIAATWATAPVYAFDGACCVTGGGAIFCNVVSADECASFGGVFHDENTECDPFPCNSTAPTGACCAADGQTCFTSTEANCIGSGQTFLGVGSSCEPYPCDVGPIGACCLEDVRFCFVTSQAHCDIFKGAFHEGLECSDLDCGRVNTPPTGACCVLGPFGQSCSVTSEASCVANGGTYFGDDSACDPLPCNPGSGDVGACCIIGGGAIICSVLHESHCAQLGGSFKGAGAACDVKACQPSTAGDCTYDDSVNMDDLLTVINHWGMSGEPGTLVADLNVNGTVDIDDLLLVVNNWNA